MPDAPWEEHLRAALAEVEAQRDDAVGYLAAIKLVLDGVAGESGPRASAQRVAEALVQALAIESCAVALGERATAGLTLAGFATQGHRFGGPRETQVEAGWLALARLVRGDGGASFFRRLPDGSFATVTAAALAGESYAVLPLVVGGEPAGALVLHSLAEPANTFGRGRALALVADIVGQALTLASMRRGMQQLCRDLEDELGVTRRALTDNQATLRTHEHHIRHLAEALISSNRVKRDFLGTVSHELRTPLNAILGYTALVREGSAGPVSDEQAGLLDRALSNTQALNGLIDDLLFFVELEADRVEVQPAPVDIRRLIDEVAAALCAGAAPAVPLDVTVAPGAEMVVLDARLVRRLLLHLLGNAFKFTREGRVTVDVGLEPAGTIVLTIRDTGIGIPADRIQSIFDLFAQADGSTTRRFSGLGMGLTLVQRCVQLLGGVVSVDSKPGMGSTFRVRIPDALAPDDVPHIRRTIH